MMVKGRKVGRRWAMQEIQVVFKYRQCVPQYPPMMRSDVTTVSSHVPGSPLFFIALLSLSIAVIVAIVLAQVE